ncbi:type I secretion system permease/ATPase [Sphingobium algorifonticola]|uniref:Type I secretion system permease/ATPase n=1 Tax=Sphingobium algorifonticola TaxID=2008318 RepID=A0A437J581_9SPHN|nr:type I secretion system permease/ATPase [Sphingobium algorifonticola]RVT39897.1 type I secretion system permease/ATPase [Sphingobium algorifonticola]
MAEMPGEKSELAQALARYKSTFIVVAIVSAVLNILLLGGSIYMMMVYDSVLPSHSIPTLFGLLIMIIIVYLFQAMFEWVRGRMLAEVATGLDRSLSTRVQRAIADARLKGARMPGDGLIAMRDLDQIRNFLGGAGPQTLIDLPWVFFFLAILFMLHVWLGVTALVGTLVLLALTFATDRASRKPTLALTQIGSVRNGMAENNLRHIEILQALGMRERLTRRWESSNLSYIDANNALARTVAVYGGASKVFRLFLQSAVLTVGALLVIDGKASGGVIFASSILAGRALAPVDQSIANWRGFTAARQGWKRLNELLRRLPPPPESAVVLAPPDSSLAVQQLAVVPPGSQSVAVQGVSFTLNAGDALGIIGPSAAGKTSLGRALIGVWPAARGTVRLDGATIDQWDSTQFGQFIGYLPQTVELLDGTIAENIARFEENAPSQAIIDAAKAADVHDMIVRLPRGYDTPVGADGAELSAGQRQRIGLARALYRDPFLVMLDEPNSNLDSEGEAALQSAVAAVKARKGIVIVIAHRPAAIALVDYILFLRNGVMEVFGPRDEVLNKTVSLPNKATKTKAPPKIDKAATDKGAATDEPAAASEQPATSEQETQ